jgi:hypothetical protein
LLTERGSGAIPDHAFLSVSCGVALFEIAD